MSLLQIIFMGTAELAVPSLGALCQDKTCKVVGVVTQPDRPKGRELKLQLSPVKAQARQLNLPVLQPERARNGLFIQELTQLHPELIVVAAYGQILPQAILDLPRFGCINVHASLLPKYRGAAPIQWALLNDETQTGVTIMKLDAGLDTGGILAQAVTAIASEDDAQTLHDRLAHMGAQLLVRTIPDYVAGRIVPQAQPGAEASYARKVTKEDGRMDWTLPARALWNRVRALTPWPGTFSFQAVDPKPRMLKIWSAEVETTVLGAPGVILRADKTGIVVGCGQQALRILQLQREGGRRLNAQEFLAGNKLITGEQLG